MIKISHSIWVEAKRIWSVKTIRLGLRLLASLLVLAFLVAYAMRSAEELSQIWAQVKPLNFLVIFPIFFVLALWIGLLWSKIVRRFGVQLPTDINVRIYLLTLAARRLPGSLLHVLGRVALYKQKGASAKVLSFASGLEIALILWSGIIVSLCLWLFNNKVQVSQIWLFVVFLGLFTLLLHPKTIRYLFIKLTHDEAVSSIEYRTILGWLLGFIGVWLGGGFILIIIVSAIYPVTASLWLPIMLAWSLSGVAGMLITFLPSGLGVADITMSIILGQFMPSSVAVSIAILSRILLTLCDFSVSLAAWGFERLNNTNGLLK